MNILNRSVSQLLACDEQEHLNYFSPLEDSIEQADRYYNLLFDEINYVCKNINAGKSMEHVRKGYRASKVKSHLIFYRVVNETIEVIRILHERMDVENRLTD